MRRRRNETTIQAVIAAGLYEDWEEAAAGDKTITVGRAMQEFLTSRRLRQQSARDRARIEKILAGVQYPGWRWRLAEAGYDGFLLCGAFERPDANTGETETGYSRWEYLDWTAGEDAVVKTAWVLVELTVRHEAMEFFTYQGKRCFDPHMPVEKLTRLERA